MHEIIKSKNQNRSECLKYLVPGIQDLYGKPFKERTMKSKKMNPHRLICIIVLLVTILLPAVAAAKSPGESSHGTIRLITDTWPPYYGPDIPKNGFFCEIVRQAFREAGYQLEVRFSDWETAKSLSKKGDYDGLLGAYFKKERTRFYTYSLPVVAVKTIFIARKSVHATYDGDLNNLKGLRIGVSKGYTYTSEFDSAAYLDKIEASGPKALFGMLIDHKIDVILISEQVAKNILLKQTNEVRSSIQALGPSLTKNKLYVLISKKNPDHLKIVSNFNEGLKILVKSGKMSTLLP